MKRKRETRSSTAAAAAQAAATAVSAALVPVNNFPDSNSMVDTDAAVAAATVAAAVASSTASPNSMVMPQPCMPSQGNSSGPEYMLSPSMGPTQPLSAKDMDVISVKQEELHMFLDSIPDFRNAVMVRGGRCIKSNFVRVVKGDNYLKDTFFTTESTPQRRIVLARETLYCRGRGNCLRACGGRGQCVEGCPKISDRASGGHYCHFQVKLFMLSTSVGTWQVRIIGSHDGPTNSWSPEGDLPSLDKACQPNNVKPELLEIEPFTDPDQVWNQNTDLDNMGAQPPTLDYSMSITADPSVTHSVRQENLREFLDGIPAYYDAIMVRGGRFIKSEYITVEKGNHYMKDKFYLKPNAPAKNVQVARETLFCSGRGNCVRRCGGIGACIKGCSRTSERASGGHTCYFQVKLAMYASAVGVWQVRIQGSHDGPVESWDKSMCRPDMMGPVDAEMLDPSVSLQGGVTDNCIGGDLSGGDMMHTDGMKVDIHSQSQGMLPHGDDKSSVLCPCPCDGSCQSELESLRQENTSLKLEMLRMRHNMSTGAQNNSLPTNEDNGFVTSRGDSFKLIEELKELIRKYDRSEFSPNSPASPSKEPAMYLMKMRNENSYVTWTKS